MLGMWVHAEAREGVGFSGAGVRGTRGVGVGAELEATTGRAA